MSEVDFATTGEDVFVFERTIQPCGYIQRPITIHLLTHRMRPEFLQSEIGLKIVAGIDQYDFVQLLNEHAALGHDRGFKANRMYLNVAAIADTDYAFAASFDLEHRLRKDAVAIGESWLYTVEKGDFTWCRPGTQLFHYA